MSGKKPETNEIAVTVSELLKVYKNPATNQGLIALTGVEFNVGRGELLAIIGPSGSGKSTLMELLAGLRRPTAGEIEVNGIKVHELEGKKLEHYRRDKVGFLRQHVADNLVSGLTIRDNIRMVQEIAGVYNSEYLNWGEELLQEVGLSDRAEHRPHELSGGEAQRAGIVVALATKPYLLLADEPTGELDSKTGDAIIMLLRKIKERFGITLIVTTHDPSLQQKSDRTLRIKDGRVSGIGIDGEELASVDQFGTVRLPEHILKKLQFAKNLKFRVEDDKVVIDDG